MDGFMDKGKCDKIFAAVRFPKESCQCPSGTMLDATIYVTFSGILGLMEVYGRITDFCIF